MNRCALNNFNAWRGGQEPHDEVGARTSWNQYRITLIYLFIHSLIKTDT